jgi:hypothetical protein
MTISLFEMRRQAFSSRWSTRVKCWFARVQVGTRAVESCASQVHRRRCRFAIGAVGCMPAVLASALHRRRSPLYDPFK